MRYTVHRYNTQWSQWQQIGDYVDISAAIAAAASASEDGSVVEVRDHGRTWAAFQERVRI